MYNVVVCSMFTNASNHWRSSPRKNTPRFSRHLPSSQPPSPATTGLLSASAAVPVLDISGVSELPGLTLYGHRWDMILIRFSRLHDFAKPPSAAAPTCAPAQPSLPPAPTRVGPGTQLATMPTVSMRAPRETVPQGPIHLGAPGPGSSGGRSQRGPASERDHIRFPSDGSSVTSCWWLAVGPGIYTRDIGRGYGASFVFPAEGHAAARGGRGQRADRGVRWDDASRGVCWPARRASVPGACASIIRDGGSLWFSSGSQRHSDPGKVRLPPAALVGPATQHLGPSPRRPASSGGERPRTEPGPARPGNLAAELCWG